MKTNSKKGVTLVELIIAMSLSALLLSAVMTTFVAIARSSVRLTNYFEMERATTRGLEQLGRELRMTQSITTSGSPITQVSLVIPDPTGTGTSTVIYRYESNARRFVRETGGKITVLIGDIEGGSFSFQRFDLAQDKAKNDYGTNQLQIAMTVSPDTHGVVASTTKRVISSRFVLRNR